MADHDASGLNLQWGRHPNGRFYIGVVAQAMAAEKGQQPRLVTVPVRSWLLTPEEEAALKAALSGILVAGNGNAPVLH